MKLEFKVSVSESDWHQMRTQWGFDESGLWTHQAALDYLENLGYDSQLSYDYSMAKYEQIIIRTFDLEEEVITLLLLKFPEIMRPVRTYEMVTITN